MKYGIKIFVILSLPLLFSGYANKTEVKRERAISFAECEKHSGRVEDTPLKFCTANEEFLGRISDAKKMSFCCQNKDPQSLNLYLKDAQYCKIDGECRIRQGACGPQAMNVYFDNSKLIEMQPFIECAEYIPIKNPRCQFNRCVADYASKKAVPPEIDCPMDVKLCPDGSYVGRVPPGCMFRECPQ